MEGNTAPINIDHVDIGIEELEDGLNVSHLKIDTSHKRNGLGTEALNRVEKLAKEMNKNYVVLNIGGGDDSIAFAKANDYELVERSGCHITAERTLDT